MQNSEIQAFANKAQLLLPDVVNRRLILPAIVGIAIGSFLQVKQGNELSPLTAFNTAHVANVARAVSMLNEEFVFDTAAAQNAARSMFLVRSRIVNGEPCEYSASPEFDFMSIALGISAVLPVETYNAIKTTGLSASSLLTLATLLVGSLKKQGKLSI